MEELKQQKKGFDLYFAAGSSLQAEELFSKLGCNRLFSWLEKRNVENWMNICDNPQCKLFIDSGAYSAYTRGVEINIDEYIEFLNKHDENITICADLDTITFEPKTPEDFIQADKNCQKTWDNYLYMKPRMKSPQKLLPVFHQWENWRWLENMLEYTDPNGNHIPYIGLSPKLDSSEAKVNFLEHCFKIIKRSSNPNVKTHAFGMTSLPVLKQFPLTSADSTTWVLVAAYGGILTEDGVVLVSSTQINNPKHIVHMHELAKQRVIRQIEKYGLTLEQVMEDYKARTSFNTHFLKEWSDNYVYQPPTVSRTALF